MMSKAGPVSPGRVAWLTPSLVALLGTAVVMLLLILPIRTFGPGDHEKKSCGNALTLDLDRWRNVPDGGDRYYEPAYRVCTTERVDRIALAVGIVSMTVLVVTVMAARMPRRGSSDSPNP
jgi:hypothetical protein